MSDQPTFEEELARKSGEALVWLDNEFARGAIQPREMYTSLIMFDMITLGLTHQEYSNWATEQRDSVKGLRPDIISFHNKKLGMVLIVELDRINGRMKSTQINGAKVTTGYKTFEHATDQIRAAAEWFDHTINEVQKKGWDIL